MSELRIVDDPSASRVEAWLGDRLAGVAEYHQDGDVRTYHHTEVDPAFEGHGIGGRLAQEALDIARAAGLRVVPSCPFIRAWIAEHPSYADLVVPQEAAG